MTFYLHWIDIGTTDAQWQAASTWKTSYAVSDEEVLSVKIDHEEGQVPSMTVQVRNPKVGLLSPSRKIWAWFSWDGRGFKEPLFFGRLVGIPTDLLSEAVTLHFTARSKTYKMEKQIIAERLQVRPFYDPVFIDQMKRDDPDTVLEGYSSLWHVDRVSLDVSTSDVLIGEDGNAIFLPSEVPYDSVAMSLNQSPLVAVAVSATVNWKQQFKGYLAIEPGIVYSYSGDGIVGDWPAPATTLGGGWTVTAAFAKDQCRISTVQNIQYTVSWESKELEHTMGSVLAYEFAHDYPGFLSNTNVYSLEITRRSVTGIIDGSTVDRHGNYAPTNIPASVEWTRTYVPMWRVKYTMGLRYDADRDRTERVEFTVKADTQPILADALIEEDTDTIEITGSDVGLPIINFKNWTSVARQRVKLGTFVFPDDPVVPGQKSIQVCIKAGVAGKTIPTFSNVAGETTQDGTVTWSSLGYASSVYNISGDWQTETLVPLGEIILPREPFYISYDDFVQPGRMQDPPSGVSTSLGLVVEVANHGFYQCTLSGITSIGKPKWKTDGDVTYDGTVEWAFIGASLPSGIDYFLCTRSGTTGKVLPRFGDGGTVVNDNTAVWTKISVSSVPVGGAPGKTPRNDYFATDRGHWSLEYLICLARSRLRMRSRAVEIEFDCSFERAVTLSCRMNATLYDDRIPGGVASGKIIGYSLEADGDKQMLIGHVKIGCSVGRDNTITTVDGDPVYCENDYVDASYQVHSGGTDLPVDDIGYTPPASNVEDKFVFPLTPDQVFTNGGVIVKGSLGAQRAGIASALSSAKTAANATPIDINTIGKALLAQQLATQAAQNSVEANLAKNPIWLELEINPVSGISYENYYALTTTDLMLPKTIDLEATTVVTPPDFSGNLLLAEASFNGVTNGTNATNVPLGHSGAIIGGESSVGVSTTLVTKTRAKFGGAGSFAAAATVIGDIKIAFSGTASIGKPKGTLSRNVYARFAGASVVRAYGGENTTGDGELMDGNGTLRAYARVINRTNPASVSGEGVLTVNDTKLSLRQRALASVAGSGSLVAAASVISKATARMAGAGKLSNPQQIGQASFDGSGILSLSVEGATASAGLSGSGSFSADADHPSAYAAFAGEGVLSESIFKNAQADLAATGLLSADSFSLANGDAGLAGNGSMVAVSDAPPVAGAAFNGNGTMVTDTSSNNRLLEDGSSVRLLEDGTTTRTLE